MSSGRPSPDGGLTEIADGVWVARHRYLDVNSVVVAGELGFVAVDTLWSAKAGAALLDECRRVAVGDMVAVVNTHHHFDHVLGNVATGTTLRYGHEAAVAAMAEHVAGIKAQVRDDPDEPYGTEILESELVLPDRILSSVAAIDLGDRVVEVVHPGRGHTGGDLVVRVPEADVLVAGDLIEQGSPPSYGADCFPLEWPGTLDFLLELLGPATAVVPGHGAVVDRELVRAQRSDIGTVAETVHRLASSLVPEQEALGAGEWPFPAEELREAVRRGYEQVPRTERRLPLA